ncbi:hypothetical protein [Roseovarius sp. ZX-A-9]|uniref:hypothetical protein n=1 Tax=Roseovarius sp. ZX-A-9 TaxID=3014783 RepID=UPI00232F4A48|nr:hypothetical protein [Roseovarius sp. ZX-A-9]
MPQTLGKTGFDFVTVLAAAKEADIRARRNISQKGLEAEVRLFDDRNRHGRDHQHIW